MTTVFLKLGGSLITNKDKPFTARRDIIRSIGKQIKTATAENPDLSILIGHGSGSFGHTAAKEANYEEWDPRAFDWQKFQRIWAAAQKLNQIVVQEFVDLELPVISFPPCAAILSSGKEIHFWNTRPISHALSLGFIPLIFGDAVLDSQIGGVIYSTEELFLFLLREIKPDSILIAGKEEGVWADYPKKNEFLSRLSEKNLISLDSAIRQSQFVDVTGGMLKKVRLMLEAKRQLPDVKIFIFSGEKAGAIHQSLTGANTGTEIV